MPCYKSSPNECIFQTVREIRLVNIKKQLAVVTSTPGFGWVKREDQAKCQDCKRTDATAADYRSPPPPFFLVPPGADTIIVFGGGGGGVPGSMSSGFSFLAAECISRVSAQEYL